MYLRCLADDELRKWVSYLAWAEFWYNNAFQASAGMTPFRALYGRDPPTLVSYTEGRTANPEVASVLQDRDEILQQLKHNLSHAQLRMKNQADKKRREVELQIADWAFVRFQPYRHLSLRLHRNQKLGPRYFGPYKVLQRLGPVAYELDLPEQTRIHPVFHISQLKRCHGEPSQQFTPLPLLPAIPAERNPALEDKDALREGGTVTYTEEGPLEANNHPTNMEDTTAGVGPESHRGVRERRVPRALEDFVMH
ncbi:hypothetical protein HRI_000659900 [Hibiscus trionum]|uniref:Tf2-1-like SH3-like domain-containing protein n=1 Tax=Hibiscus trionum TaxID=183268 RepID=A0A9W7LN19_HIBTR|nr:hypothetical protein HRI_000659900 [Hibiscus trionum]